MTVVIIDAHERNYWDFLCNAYDVAIPATVIENEAFYFQSDHGKVGLKPTEWIEKCKVKRMEAKIDDLEALHKKLTSDFLASIDPGELEALAILISKAHQDSLFTTADRAAIKALGVLSLSHRGISVEAFLEEACRKVKKGMLPTRFTKKWFHQAIAEGFSEQHIWLKRA